MAGFLLVLQRAQPPGARRAKKMIPNHKVARSFRPSAGKRNPVLYDVCCCHCSKTINRPGDIDMS